MSDVFISYARSTAAQAQAAAVALRGLGYTVWLDDELLAHHAYTHAIEAQLTAAKVALVIWSAEAVKSEWVLSEANRAREDRKLVQLTLDGARLPMPFDQTQCADLRDWNGDVSAPGWRKVVGSIGELIGGAAPAPAAEPAPPPLPDKPSIAVMPFANLSGDPEQEYFTDGMVVEIVEALSRIRSIFVIASGSSLSLKGKGMTAQDAARRLGVRYVLEGSVRKAGGRVRIGAQLIDAADGAQIWTHRFEDSLEDVFALQDSVALAVAGEIEPNVIQAEMRRAAARPTDNPSSYDLYLRALRLQRTLVRANVLEALELTNQAVALDPEFGPALGLAGVCHFFVVWSAWSDDREGHRRLGVEMARRALKASPDDPRTLANAAHALAYFEGDYEAAMAVLGRAIALNPGCAHAFFISGVVRVRAGKSDLAIDDFAASLRLDPLASSRPLALGFTGQALFQQGRFSEAVPPLKESIQQLDVPLLHALLAACHGQLGQTEAAHESLARFRALSALPVDVYAAEVTWDLPDRKLFLEGIALAEGESLGEAMA